MRVSITICISYMNKMFSEFIRSNLQRDINIIRIDYEYVCTCVCLSLNMYVGVMETYVFSKDTETTFGTTGILMTCIFNVVGFEYAFAYWVNPLTANVPMI